MEILFVKEPRFQFSSAEEFLVRFLGYTAHVFLFFITVFLLVSRVSSLTALGFLFALFLFDRLIHIGEGERSLSELFYASKKRRVNISLGFPSVSSRILIASFREAKLTRKPFLFVALNHVLQERGISEIISRAGSSPSFFRVEAEKLLSLPSERASAPILQVEETMRRAYTSALSSGEKFVRPRNLFSALCSSADPRIISFLTALNISPSDIEEAALFERHAREFAHMKKLPATLGGYVSERRFQRNRAVNRAWTSRPTPLLDSLSEDFTELARREKVGFLIGHKEEYEKMLDVISRPGKPNALLVGEPGVGKTTLVHHLAFRIVHDDVPPVLFDKRLVSLNIAQLFSNVSSDQLSGRLPRIAEEIALAGNIVLFISDVHNLFKIEEKGRLSPIDVFLPIIKNISIPTIGETYSREFKREIQMKSDFLDQFEVVRVQEMSENEAVRFLVYSSLILEREFRVFTTLRVIREAVRLAKRYITDQPLPSSALDLLKETYARASREHIRILKEDLVGLVLQNRLKIPIVSADSKEADNLLHLEEIIHKRLVGQDEAVSAVSRALREYRAGLSRRGGPIAVFLFVGPTGVGKTECAKILSEVQFGSREMMRRFDMSEYQDRQSIFRLIGTPDGEKTGDLTDTIYEHPYSLILLDEFEKAHPDVLNLFLQVFDDGRLTDSLGRTVDFQNTIIVATSNANSDFIKEEIEKGRGVLEIADEITSKLTEYFKPELLNRFSDIIVFRDLTRDEITKIAELLIQEVSRMLFDSQGIELIISNEISLRIAEIGYSKVFGARPLRKIISEEFRGKLAEMILRKEVQRGDRIKVSFGGGEFLFKKE